MQRKKLKINIDEIPRKAFVDFIKKNKVLNLRLSKI